MGASGQLYRCRKLPVSIGQETGGGGAESVEMWWRKIKSLPLLGFEPRPFISYEGVSKSFRTESITKYTTINTRWEAIQRVVAAKLTRLTHKIAIQLHLVAESCTISTSRSRRPVRRLLDTSSFTYDFIMPCCYLIVGTSGAFPCSISKCCDLQDMKPS
jgi:hypothetical protein